MMQPCCIHLKTHKNRITFIFPLFYPPPSKPRDLVCQAKATFLIALSFLFPLKDLSI